MGDKLFSSMLSQKQINKLLPLACEWTKEQEGLILQNGVALIESELNDAKRIGVAFPEKVRLLRIDEIPKPKNSDLALAIQILDFLTPSTIGLSLRYGIFIQSDNWRRRNLVVHELVHTMQYERLGGFEQFLKQYLEECMEVGYLFSPLEQEARRIEKEICF
jgi:hypothetical protein